MSKVYQSKIAKYAGHTEGPWDTQEESCECEPPCGCDNPYPYKILAPSRKVSPYKNNPDWKESAEIVDFMEVNVPLPVPEARANAALIADAPYLACEVERLRELCGELVGALAKCADMLDEIHMMHPDMKWTDSIRATIVARKTIAKAKGGDEITSCPAYEKKGDNQ